MLFLLTALSPLRGQAIRGDVTGTVSDPTGAVSDPLFGRFDQFYSSNSRTIQLNAKFTF
jgi:hypothetical protein